MRTARAAFIFLFPAAPLPGSGTVLQWFFCTWVWKWQQRLLARADPAVGKKNSNLAALLAAMRVPLPTLPKDKHSTAAMHALVASPPYTRSPTGTTSRPQPTATCRRPLLLLVTLSSSSFSMTHCAARCASRRRSISAVRANARQRRSACARSNWSRSAARAARYAGDCSTS